VGVAEGVDENVGVTEKVGVREKVDVTEDVEVGDGVMQMDDVHDVLLVTVAVGVTLDVVIVKLRLSVRM
jgi:hypothetical protein